MVALATVQKKVDVAVDAAISYAQYVTKLRGPLLTGMRAEAPAAVVCETGPAERRELS